MIARALVIVALIALAAAIGAHVAGEDTVAEIAGNAAFFVLLVATFVPHGRAGHRDGDGDTSAHAG